MIKMNNRSRRNYLTLFKEIQTRYNIIYNDPIISLSSCPTGYNNPTTCTTQAKLRFSWRIQNSTKEHLPSINKYFSFVYNEYSWRLRTLLVRSLKDKNNCQNFQKGYINFFNQKGKIASNVAILFSHR